eukprot:561737-Pelagomonas_calceolata.AAC.1
MGPTSLKAASSIRKKHLAGSTAFCTCNAPLSGVPDMNPIKFCPRASFNRKEDKHLGSPGGGGPEGRPILTGKCSHLWERHRMHGLMSRLTRLFYNLHPLLVINSYPPKVKQKVQQLTVQSIASATPSFDQAPGTCTPTPGPPNLAGHT